MKSSKEKVRPKRPEPARPASRFKAALLVLAAVAAACLIVWVLVRENPSDLVRQAEPLLERDPKQAGDLLERAIYAAGGDYPHAQVLLCEALARQSRWIEALGCLALIKDKSQCDGGRLLLLAREALQAGEFSLAEHALDAATEAGASQAEVLTLTIQLRLALGRDDEALDLCRQLAQIAPREAFAPSVEARLLRRRAEILPALDAYRLAVKLSTNSVKRSALRRELVELLIQKRDATEARSELDLLLDESGEQDGSALLQSQVLRLEGRSDEALAQVEAHLTRVPDDAEGLFLRGTLWLEMEKYEPARQDLERVVARYPFRKEAHYKLGQALSRLGQEGAAKEHLETSARLTAQTQEILTLSSAAARDPQNESIQKRLNELYEAIGVSRPSKPGRGPQSTPRREP